MCVAKLTQLILNYYASFKHRRLNNSTKTFWKGRPAFYYYIRSSDVLNSLEWSNLEERRKRHLLVTMLKIFNNDCPTYLRERFHRTSEIHDYNLRGSNYDLQLPLPKTNFLKRSFSYRGAMAWNQLSNETREMGDLTSFKLAIS